MTAPDALEMWDRELSTAGRVTLSPGRIRTALALLGAMVFTAIGLIMVVTASGNQGQMAIGLVTVAFFGLLGLPSLGMQILRADRQAVVINETGIALPRQATVPWSAIRDFVMVRVGRTDLPGIQVDPVFLTAMLQRQSRRARTLANANGSLVQQHALFFPSTLRVDQDLLGAWLQRQLVQRQSTGVR